MKLNWKANSGCTCCALSSNKSSAHWIGLGIIRNLHTWMQSPWHQRFHSTNPGVGCRWYLRLFPSQNNQGFMILWPVLAKAGVVIDPFCWSQKPIRSHFSDFNCLLRVFSFIDYKRKRIRKNRIILIIKQISPVARFFWFDYRLIFRQLIFKHTNKWNKPLSMSIL